MKEVSPIKDIDDVKAIYNRLKKWGNDREAELVMLGCNAALRIGDLLLLKFSDIQTMTVDGKLVGFVDLNETKTSKAKRLTLNASAMAAIARLKAANPDNVYLFQGKGNNTSKEPKPITRQYVSKKLIEVKESLSLPYPFNTHSLRKTFGYHAYKRGVDINVLQKLFNHSSVRETFRYIGITDENVRDTYLNIEIGI